MGLARGYFFLAWYILNKMAEEITVEAKDGEKLIKRPMKWDDFEAVERLAKPERYNSGLHNLKLYHETSPHTWFVIVNKQGEIVAYDTYNRLPIGDIHYGYQLVVRPDYRSKGLTKSFSTFYYTHRCMGNASANSLIRYKVDWYGDKFIGFVGKVGSTSAVTTVKPNKQPADLKIVPVEQVQLQDFLNYDRAVLGFDRSDFIAEWVLAKKYPCKTTTFVAQKGQTVCGYGTLREYCGYMAISPLYADDEIVAEWLLYRLVESLPMFTEIYIYFPAKNRCIMKWVHRLNMTCINTEIRDNVDVPKGELWDMSRVYAIHDYYPV